MFRFSDTFIRRCTKGSAVKPRRLESSPHQRRQRDTSAVDVEVADIPRAARQLFVQSCALHSRVAWQLLGSVGCSGAGLLLISHLPSSFTRK